LKALVVTADDFGLHEAVNEAIERAALQGVLSATSLMVAEAAADDAVRRARALPELAVGLHVVLADGHALLPPRRIPALVDGTGRFPDRMAREGARFFALPRVRRQLEAEIRAQFAAFAATGLAFDHVNAHKHFHLHPTVLGMLLAIGAEYGSPPMRWPREPLWAARRAGAGLAGALLSPWLALMRRRLRAAGVKCNETLFGISTTGAMDEARLLEILAHLPEGLTEIYLHPATRDGLTPGMSAYRHRDELDALLSARVRAAVRASGARTGGFRALTDALRSSGGSRRAA
jgi:hopanoid biosynthesis associated protein HpnK